MKSDPPLRESPFRSLGRYVGRRVLPKLISPLFATSRNLRPSRVPKPSWEVAATSSGFHSISQVFSPFGVHSSSGHDVILSQR